MAYWNDSVTENGVEVHYSSDCELYHLDIVNIGLHFFHKDVRLMLPLVAKHSIVAA